MKSLNIVCVGKLSDKNIESLEKDYCKRIKNPRLKIFELKSHKENRELEFIEIEKKLKALSPTTIIPLTETGKEYDSISFSKWINKELISSSSLTFVIGGAAGLDRKFLKENQKHISLSPLTFPHKIARLLLVEQLYRTQTILQAHPYHK